MTCSYEERQRHAAEQRESNQRMAVFQCRIAKLEAQNKELLAACKEVIIYAEHGPAERSNCSHTHSAPCDSLCEHESGWMQAMSAAQKAIIRAERRIK